MDKQKIKVLAINTSPRKGRNTDQLLDEVIAGCLSVSAGADECADTGSAGSGSVAEPDNTGTAGSGTDLGSGSASANPARTIGVEVKRMGVYEAADDDLKFCRGCWACAKTGSCVCGDDFIKQIHDAIAESDVVIFGVPVYFYSVTAQCKAIMDRALAYMPIGNGKVSATAITCGSAGVASTLQAMQSFYSCNDFIDAGWVATYGKTSDKVKGREVAYGLGRKAVRLAVMLKGTYDVARAAKAAGNGELLKDLEHSNHFAYGTHTF